MLPEQCAAGAEVHPRLQERALRTSGGRQEHDEGVESAGRRTVVRRTYIVQLGYIYTERTRNRKFLLTFAYIQYK